MVHLEATGVGLSSDGRVACLRPHGSSPRASRNGDRTYLDKLVDGADSPPGQLREEDHTFNVVVFQQGDVSAHFGDAFHLRPTGRRRFEHSCEWTSCIASAFDPPFRPLVRLWNRRSSIVPIPWSSPRRFPPPTCGVDVVSFHVRWCFGSSSSLFPFPSASPWRSVPGLTCTMTTSSTSGNRFSYIRQGLDMAPPVWFSSFLFPLPHRLGRGVDSFPVGSSVPVPFRFRSFFHPRPFPIRVVPTDP